MCRCVAQALAMSCPVVMTLSACGRHHSQGTSISHTTPLTARSFRACQVLWQALFRHLQHAQ